MSNLIGSQLNQVPTNSDLGDLAFQNATSLKQVTANAVTGKDIYLQSSGTGSTPTLNLNFYSMDLVRNNYIDSLITFQRNTTATVWKYDANNNPVLATVGVDVPRYEIDPVTGDIKGLLIEEQRTNLLLYSTSWNANSNITSTPAASIAPDSSISATSLIPNTTAALHQATKDASLVAGTTYTLSFYCKSFSSIWVGINGSFSSTWASGASWVARVDNTSASSGCTVTPVGNGWFRVTGIVATPTVTASAAIFFRPINSSSSESAAGDGITGMYIWGAQLEVGSFSTSYIPTTNAAVTRNADYISFPTSSFYNSTGGTLVLDGTTGNSTTSKTFVALNNASATEQIGIRLTSTGATQMFNDSASTTTGDPGTGTKGALPTIPVNTRFKAAFVFGTNDFRGSVNGTSVRSDTSGALATGITTMNIGSRNNSTSENCNAYIGSIQYYTGRFSDTILQELSA